MGAVYLAEDPKLKRRIAIKVLPAHFAGDNVGLTRFVREAQCLAAINHPNIATIYSLEESDGEHFLTMELVSGETLAKHLETGPLQVDAALRVCRQIARGLEAAHEAGVIHRDLKPLNVMVTPQELVKVLDFGLAKAVADDAVPLAAVPPGGTSAGILGTPGYMSPEQVRAEKVDHRADVWSLGCVLFECLTGERVFSGKTPLDLLVATLEREPDWTLLPIETPEQVRALLERSLAKDPGARASTIAEVQREISEAIAQRSLPAAMRRRRAEEEVRSGNLPRPFTKFVGRVQAIEDVKGLLDEHRLLTLTGAGGCGKTRLALEIAWLLLDRYPDGVWLVELASLADPALVPQTVAESLGLKEQAGRTFTQTLIEDLRAKKLLLILDNCEHLVEACAELTGALLHAAPYLRILATSRQGLRITGESIYLVTPLSVPPEDPRMPVEELREIEAVRLFVERASAVNTSFTLEERNVPAVVQICRRLDGIALALELAAARVKALSVAEIARRLDDRFRLLTVGGKTSLRHHQTLRALIDWSYDQLDEAEKRLFRRLSVFAGGWRLNAAEAVCAGGGIGDWEVLDLLSNLVDKSLVELDIAGAAGSGKARYRMLETIRQYASNRLAESQEGVEVRRRHRAHYVKLAEKAEPRLSGADQPAWLARLGEDHDNLRTALDVSAGDAADAVMAMRLAGALGRYWMLRGHWTEGRGLCAGLLGRSEAQSETAVRSKVLNWAGNLAFWQDDYEEARASFEASLAFARRHGDRFGIAGALNNLGLVAQNLCKYDEARALYEKSAAIKRELDDRPGLARSLDNLGEVARMQGDYARARTYYEECLAIRRDLGDLNGGALLCNHLAKVAESEGDIERARSLYEQGLATYRRLGLQEGIARSLLGIGGVAEKQRDYAQARMLYDESLAIRRTLGHRSGIAESLCWLGRLCGRQGDADRARGYFRESLMVLRHLGDRLAIAAVLESVARLEGGLDQPWRAARLLGAAETLRESIQAPLSPAEREEHGRDVSAVREAVGRRRFQTEWERGRRATLEEVTEFALGGTGDGQVPTPGRGDS